MKTTGIVSLLCLFLLLETIILAGAQPATGQNPNKNPYSYAGFNPTVVIVIVIALTSLFFMVFFAIYVRECSGRSSPLLPQNFHRINLSHGLDRARVETFPVFTYSEVKEHKIVAGGMECAVCLNEFEDHEMLRLIPKCDHVFHPECIDAWLASHVTCPVCRADLVPEPGNEPVRAIDSTSSVTEDCNGAELGRSSSRNDDIIIHVEDENQRSNQSSGPGRFGVGKFRSYSTGHSLGQTEGNHERFTLRLPIEVRKEMINRASLNRARSNNTIMLPREESCRKGYRTAVEGEGSNRAHWSDRKVKSDRWAFLARTLSIRSPRMRVEMDDGCGSTSRTDKPTKLASFKCLEPRAADETGLVSVEPAKL